MWAYKYQQKDTRTQVPSYKKFMFANHDLLKLWYEDQMEPTLDRISFPMRVLRFTACIGILFIFLFLVIAPQESTFQFNCAKR